MQLINETEDTILQKHDQLLFYKKSVKSQIEF